MLKKFKEFFKDERKELTGKMYNFFNIDVSDINEALHGISDYIDLSQFPYPEWRQIMNEFNEDEHFGFQVSTTIGAYFIKIINNKFCLKDWNTEHHYDTGGERGLINEILERYDKKKNSGSKDDHKNRKPDFELQIRFKKREEKSKLTEEEKEIIEEVGERIKDVLKLKSFRWHQTSAYEIYLHYDILED